MLKLSKKSTKSNKWELIALTTASEAALYCDTAYEFINYFESKINEYPRDSVGTLADSYKAKVDPSNRNIVGVWHLPAHANARLIATVEREVKQ